MSIDWESILPMPEERFGVTIEESRRCCDVLEARDRAIVALKAAESRGEICKPLSVKEIRSIIGEEWVKQYIDVDQVCEAIHAAMTRRKE